MSEIEDRSRSLSSNTIMLIGAFVSLMFLNILSSAYSPVLTLIRNDLPINYTLTGLLMSMYFFGYTLGQIPWGIATDKFGIRRVMTISLFGIATLTILFSLAADYWQMIITRFFAGLLGAGLYVPAIKMTSMWFSSRERGIALGILNVGTNLGLVAVSYASPFLALSLGWRGSLMVLGALGIMASGLALLSLRDRQSVSSTERRHSLSETAKCKSFWILGFMQFLRLGANYTFIAWLPIFIQEEYGLNLLVAGTVFSLFNWAGMFSSPLGGFISDRKGEKLILLPSFLTLTLVITVFVGLKTPTVLYLGVFLLGWLINFVRGPIFAIIPRLWGTEIAGGVSGIQNTFASAGALAMPFLLGYVKDVTGSYNLGWSMLSLLLLSGTILGLFIKS